MSQTIPAIPSVTVRAIGTVPTGVTQTLFFACVTVGVPIIVVITAVSWNVVVGIRNRIRQAA